jgi:hypothetical protein
MNLLLSRDFWCVPVFGSMHFPCVSFNIKYCIITSGLRVQLISAPHPGFYIIPLLVLQIAYSGLSFS